MAFALSQRVILTILKFKHVIQSDFTKELPEQLPVSLQV